jgi:hypothetical protein
MSKSLAQKIKATHEVASFGPIKVLMLPTLDNLRNFLLTTTTEVVSFFQELREVPKTASYAEL